MAHIHGIDEANYNMDWGPKILDQWYDDRIPVIKEITVYYTAYVCGIKIIYREGEETHFEHIVDQPGQEIREKTHKLKQGEYVCKVEGRVGCVVDELKFYTNFGRKLKGGDDGGGECEPEYVGRPYVFAFDFHFHHLMAKADIFYVDLDKVPAEILPDLPSTELQCSKGCTL